MCEFTEVFNYYRGILRVKKRSLERTRIRNSSIKQMKTKTLIGTALGHVHTYKVNTPS